MSTVFIAGAGCSRGTLDSYEYCRPPTAAEFVTEMKNRVRGWADEYPAINKVVEHLEKTANHVGLEELWTCIDLHAKFPGAFPISWEPRDQVVSELKRLLVRLYGRTCDALADHVSRSDCTVAEIARTIQAGDSLISFNYDTVVERIVRQLSRKPLRHGKDLRPGTIRFAKPHGSASWVIGNLEHRVTDGEPLWDSVAEADVRAGADPLLLGAVPLKSELIFEVQDYYRARRVFEVIREQWQALANAVATAERIVVLGYSFPKEDAYGRFFFREGMSMRGDQPMKVDYYSLCEHQQELERVFPKANPICFRGKVTAPQDPCAPIEAIRLEMPPEH